MAPCAGAASGDYRFHDHIKLAHYANAACNIEFKFPMGFKELEGIRSRTDFDLRSHEKFSGRKLTYFDSEADESYVPYVVETSIGLDRMFLAVLSAAYEEEKLEGGEERVVLRIPAPLAPVKVAVMPLVKKDGLPEKARAIIDGLKLSHNCQFDKGQHRQTLPPSGRHGHAVLHHRRLRNDAGQHGDLARARQHEAGACGHRRPRSHREREGGTCGSC